MAHIDEIVSAPASVIASLQNIPEGRVRLSFEVMRIGPRGLEIRALEPFPTSLDLEASRLRTLKFSQEELAEIGFNLLVRLASFVARDA